MFKEINFSARSTTLAPMAKDDITRRDDLRSDIPVSVLYLAAIIYDTVYNLARYNTLLFTHYKELGLEL